MIGTAIDLQRIVKIDKPSTRVYYDLQEIGHPTLEGILNDFVEENGLQKPSLFDLGKAFVYLF